MAYNYYQAINSHYVRKHYNFYLKSGAITDTWSFSNGSSLASFISYNDIMNIEINLIYALKRGIKNNFKVLKDCFSIFKKSNNPFKSI